MLSPIQLSVDSLRLYLAYAYFPIIPSGIHLPICFLLICTSNSFLFLESVIYSVLNLLFLLTLAWSVPPPNPCLISERPSERTCFHHTSGSKHSRQYTVESFCGSIAFHAVIQILPATLRSFSASIVVM